MLLSTAVLSSSAWGQASTPATGATTEPVTPVVLDSPGTSAAAPVAPTTPSTAPEPVSARTPEAASAASNPDTVNGNDNIVVTARFRNERLQDTPLSISAFNAAAIQNSVITEVNSLQKLLPNVQLSRIQYSGQALGASIRGVSFSDLEKTFDPAIGVSIDGVFLGTNTGANVDFSDLESIEVLRGPQGTLYGRNTVGGTISIRRTRPTGVLGAKFGARYASFNSLDLDGVVNLPEIGDLLSFKLFGQRLRGDAFTRNRYTGKREPGRKFYSFGGSMLVNRGGDTTALVTVEYQKDRSNYASAVNLTLAGGRPFGTPGGTICDYTRAIGLGDLACASQGYLRQRDEDYQLANTSYPFESFFDGWNASLEINSKIGRFNLTAITGYRDTSDLLRDENTGTPPVSYTGPPGTGIPLFFTSRDQKYKQFSQEVRLQGDLTSWADIVAGVYYLHTNYEIQPAIANGSRAGNVLFAVPIPRPGLPPLLIQAPIQRFTAGQKLDSYAIFAETILKLGSGLRLTIGGRYTTETKDFHIEQQLPVVFNATGKKTFSDPTGRVILDYKPNEDMLFYASWSRGYRSGGFNGRATTATAIGPYNPEKVDSYEAGMKADFAGGKIRFNPTVFWVDYTQKQEEILRAAVGGGTETIVENAATARIKGIELEILARPVPELTLRASGGYLDPEYRSFLVPNTAVPGTFTDNRPIANFRRAPKYTGNASLDYLTRLNTNNSINLKLAYSYIDDIRTSPRIDVTGNRRDIISSHGAFDASVALIHTGTTLKNFRLAAYINDAFHKGNRITNTLDAGVFYFGQISPQREMGIEATVRF